MSTGTIPKASGVESRARLTVDIDPTLRRDLRMEALERGIPLHEYISRIMERRELVLQEIEGEK